MKLMHRAGSCDNGPCPNIFETDVPVARGAADHLVAVQGTQVTDPEALARLANMPAHETLVLVPPSLLLEYVTGTYAAGEGGDFDAYFNRFNGQVVRIETRQHYAVTEEDARIAAFRRGLPRPERSVRTSPWLRRIAFTTALGKQWQRIRIVEHPLSEYLRYQLPGYSESLAAGEEILIADRAAAPELAGLRDDFWLFDAGTPNAFALLMEYDGDGRFTGYEHTTDPEVITRCVRQRDTAAAYTVPLNTYLAQTGKPTRKTA